MPMTKMHGALPPLPHILSLMKLNTKTTLQYKGIVLTLKVKNAPLYDSHSI
jgi:hypothetical protein